MDKEVRTVTNITELILALYDQVPTLKVTGSLANNLYYASRNLRLIGLTIVVLFTALFSALYRPNLMVPIVIICLGLLGLFSLPIIFLFMAQVSLRTLSKVRRNYQVQSFNSGSQELIYCLRTGEPTTAQGERNLRSLRLVLPLHHKFKFRHHAAAATPVSALDSLAAASASAVTPSPAAIPSPAATPEAPQPDSVSAAPKPKRTVKNKAAAKTAAASEASAATKAKVTAVAKTADQKASSAAQAPASTAAQTSEEAATQGSEEAAPQVLTRVINRRKKTKPAASADAAH